MLAVVALAPFFAAFLLLAVRNDQPRLAAWLSGLTALLACAGLIVFAPTVFNGEVVRWSIEWLPALGLELGFRMDGLAWMFSLLVLGIGALVVLYAAFYLDPKDPRARFYTYFMLFMGSMLGVVLADNLVLLVVFWELTSLSSFLLIGFWHEDTKKGVEAREGARMALTITGGGGLCLLAGVLLIGNIVGSTDLDRVLASGDLIRAHPLYEVALVLVLLAAFTKSAQFPFHFWLPHAMAAPTPVSAYLHSATMVKAGVFLLARLYPALGQSEPWFWIVSSVGLVTLVFGAYMALFKHDLKSLLAYSTVSHLGLITCLFGINQPLAIVAGVFHILNHATFKAALFMTAGIIDHETGTRDMRQLNSLWKFMPVTGLLAMVASAAMAGLPPLNGFLSKEMFFAETLANQPHVLMAWLLPIGATVAGAFGVAYSLRFVDDVFFNEGQEAFDTEVHEPPLFMRLPVYFLVLLCIAVGLAPAVIAGPLLTVAAKAALLGPNVGQLPDYSLSLWHGFNMALLMSAIAVFGGALIYFGLKRRVNFHRLHKAPVVPKVGGKDIFMASLTRTIARASSATGKLQSNSLQNYLLALVLIALAAGAIPFLRGGQQLAPSVASPSAGFAFIALWAIGIGATIATVVFHRQRLLSLILMGAVGLVVCLTFVYFSAPDLALTQLLVEVATIILMMLALAWLPNELNGYPAQRSHSEPADGRLRRYRDAIVSIAAGLGVAALTWMVLGRPFDSIAPYYLTNTATQGGGANAVNVIIVDFRGFDTMGEITVMGIAALIIHAILNHSTPLNAASSRVGVEVSNQINNDLASGSRPLMLALVARAVLPFATMISVYLFLRGHNLPGGGFIAGLVLAIGLIAQFMANGQRFARERMNADFVVWVAWGLLIAGATGIGSWWFGAPFLTSTYDYPVWPLVGEVPLASASLFDLGVFVLVVGATMVALTSMGQINHAQRTVEPPASTTSTRQNALGKGAQS
jgi:multicomponent K+:H+ antiporter subunit A